MFQVIPPKSLIRMVPMEGVEPTHSHEYQILSLARLPIPPHRLLAGKYKSRGRGSARVSCDFRRKFPLVDVGPRSVGGRLAWPESLWRDEGPSVEPFGNDP